MKVFGVYLILAAGIIFTVSYLEGPTWIIIVMGFQFVWMLTITEFVGSIYGDMKKLNKFFNNEVYIKKN